MTASFRVALATGASLALMAGASISQVYKWVDEKGVTHYSERPPAKSRALTAKKLDIELQGNDPPAPVFASEQDCNTIRCQYERLRKDRLLREAEEREEEEARARILAMQKPSAFAPPPNEVAWGNNWVNPGIPIYRRPIVGQPLPLPLPSPLPSPVAPAGGSRTTEGIGRR
jgi:hypothetical protein